jgi:hypothetical protein
MFLPRLAGCAVDCPCSILVIGGRDEGYVCILGRTCYISVAGVVSSLSLDFGVKWQYR